MFKNMFFLLLVLAIKLNGMNGKLTIYTKEKQPINHIIIGNSVLRIQNICTDLGISRETAQCIHDDLHVLDESLALKIVGYDIIKAASQEENTYDLKKLAFYLDTRSHLSIYFLRNNAILTYKEYYVPLKKIHQLCWFKNNYLLAINDKLAIHLIKIDPKATIPFYHHIKTLFLRNDAECLSLKLPENVGVPISIRAHPYKSNPCIVGNYNAQKDNSTFFCLNLATKTYKKIGTSTDRNYFSHFLCSFDLPLSEMCSKLSVITSEQRETFIEDCLKSANQE